MDRDHLAIEFSDYHVRFVAFSGERITEDIHTHLGEFDENERKARLQTFVDQHAFLKEDFKEVTLSWFCSTTTIVPNNIFVESSPSEIFKLCFGEEFIESEIDYNRISEQSVINVYRIPTWIKSFFVIRYPRVVIQHEGSHLIRQAMQKGFKLKIYAVFHEANFKLAIVKHNNLEYYSTFGFQSFEDVLYHLLFVLQQKELTDESGELLLIEGVGTPDNLLKELIEHIQKVRDLSKLTIAEPEHYIAKSQKLCV